MGTMNRNAPPNPPRAMASALMSEPTLLLAAGDVVGRVLGSSAWVKSGGGLADAPLDGETYGRRDAGWLPVLSLEGGEMTGPLTLFADPAGAMEPATKQYTDDADIAVSAAFATADLLRVAKAGDTMTGPLQLPAAAPTLTAHATNKAYVDALISTLDLWKGSWLVASPEPARGNGFRYLCRTADPDVPENAPAGMPGVAGRPIYDGSYIVFDVNAGNVWQLLPAGTLTVGEADTRYLQDAPNDGAAYGRRSEGWAPVLPLTGGTLTGQTNIVRGVVNQSMLQFTPSTGLPDNTGLERSTDATGSISIRLQGTVRVQFLSTGISTTLPLSMGSQIINSLADAVAATDAVNLRTLQAAVASTDLYQGAWSPAANIPALPADPDNGSRWMVTTVNPLVSEVVPGAIAGIAGRTVFNGDFVVWDQSLAVYQILHTSSNLTRDLADTRYLQLTGGMLSGRLGIGAGLYYPTIDGADDGTAFWRLPNGDLRLDYRGRAQLQIIDGLGMIFNDGMFTFENSPGYRFLNTEGADDGMFVARNLEYLSIVIFNKYATRFNTDGISMQNGLISASQGEAGGLSNAPDVLARPSIFFQDYAGTIASAPGMHRFGDGVAFASRDRTIACIGSIYPWETGQGITLFNGVSLSFRDAADADDGIAISRVGNALKLAAIVDATLPQEAMNRRASDARYAPITSFDDMMMAATDSDDFAAFKVRAAEIMAAMMTEREARAQADADNRAVH